jgi:hypothetical protein
MNDQNYPRSSNDMKGDSLDESIPNELEIEYLLGRIQPKPSGGFYKDIEQSPWNQNNSPLIWSRLRIKRLPIMITILVIVIVILGSPSLGAVANRIARFFTPAADKLVIIEIPLLDLSTIESQQVENLSIASNLLGFEVITPVPTPQGYTFSGIEFKPDREAIILNYESISGNIIRISQRRNGVEYQSVSTQAIIEPIMIGDQMGEYVVGGWKAKPTDIDSAERDEPTTFEAVWDPDGNIHFLRWQENDILYEILFIGNNPKTNDYLNKEDLISIAESLG